MKRALLIAGLAVVSFGCSSSSTTSSDSSSSSSSSSSNSLSVTFPGDLAVTSPTASSSSSSSLEVQGLKADTSSTTVTTEDFATRKNAIKAILEGSSSAACKFSINFAASATKPNCYGPTLNYTNHPDCAGMTVPNQCPNGQLPQGDTGIWTASEASTGEACVAAQTNYLMGTIDNYVKTATEMGAAILCVANTRTTKLSLPAKGESADLTTDANTVMSTNGVPLTITSALLSRNASDDAAGNPVYKMTVSGTATITFGGQTASQAPSFTMTITHIPPAASVASALSVEGVQALTIPDSYSGIMTFKMNIPNLGQGPFSQGGNCSDSTGRQEAISVVYNKASATSLTYQLKRALFCGKDGAVFASDGTVDLTKVLTPPATTGTGWTDDAYNILATVNPSDGTGSFAQAWQAGGGDGATRVLNVKVSSDGTGTGYFGFGPATTASSGVGSITKMICNWAGPSNSHTGVSKAQQENFTKNTTTGIYTASTTGLAITYAPTNACDKTVAQSFAYGIQSPPTDVKTTDAVTNNLIAVSAISFTVPTAPTPP